jgi:hypothetical protein
MIFSMMGKSRVSILLMQGDSEGGTPESMYIYLWIAKLSYGFEACGMHEYH